MKIVALGRVKNQLSEYVERAQKEDIVITRHGKPVARLVRSDPPRRGASADGGILQRQECLSAAGTRCWKNGSLPRQRVRIAPINPPSRNARFAPRATPEIGHRAAGSFAERKACGEMHTVAEVAVGDVRGALTSGDPRKRH